MQYDQPDIHEIERLLGFCKKYEKIFIYGCDEKQQKLAKYLHYCGIKISGFIISTRGHFEMSSNGFPVFIIEELKEENKETTGFIMGLPGFYLNEVMLLMQRYGFNKNIFFMSEYNKRTIAYKMRPRIRDNFWIEVNIVDHCNLNCQMCDHFSTLADPYFLSVEEYEADIKRLAELANGDVGIIKLQGGEPLMHPRLVDFIRITRRYFSHSRIFLFTNGLLLRKWETEESGNLWAVCKENNVVIELTKYPIALDYEELIKKAKEYDVQLDCFSNAGNREASARKVSVKHPFDCRGEQDVSYAVCCYQFNESITLRHGKVYTCPIIPYGSIFSDYFNLEIRESAEDGIDIYKAKTFEEISEFVAKPTKHCRFCDVRHRMFDIPWEQSKKSIEEWT